VVSLYWSVEGDGPAVVLLHAGGLDSRMFEPDVSELARSARVLRYDRSGSGRSPACKGPVDRVEELRVVRTMAFGERPAVLVGCSVGGQLAVDFALSYPALVGGLLLVGPGLSGAEVSDDRRARMARLVAAAEQGGDELADAWLRDQHLAPHGFSSATTRLVRTMLRDNVGLFRAPPASVAARPALSRLDRLAAPGHVLVGDHDDADNHAIARTITRAAHALQLHLVPGAGHFPMLERVGWLPQTLVTLLPQLESR
jgi:pimeloyl-ACP methyl ester carboxylesterase